MMLPTLLNPQILQQKKAGDPYLKVLLQAGQAAVLPMAQAQEAIAIPAGRVTPIPNMPVCVLGLLNHKSRVIWVVNLPQMLGLESQRLNVQRYSLAIIRSGKTSLGLVVPEIRGVVRLDTEAIQPLPKAVQPEQAPYVQGCLIQDQEIIWVLDAVTIIESSIFAEN
jgi:positive phototaxis protein PixI